MESLKLNYILFDKYILHKNKNSENFYFWIILAV